MKIVADTHTHTLASTHAYSTILENAKYASEIGLAYLAMTDHAPALPDSPHHWHLLNLRMVPDELFGVKILKGAEANILDETGEIDLSNDVINALNWVVASFHDSACRHEMTYEQCNQAYIAIANNKKIDVIGHSGSDGFKYDYEKILPIFKKNNKLVEINENSFTVRNDSKENCITIAKLCKKLEIPIIVNSDAHFAYSIGKVDNALKLLQDIDFPQELIVNSSIELFEKYLNSRI